MLTFLQQTGQVALLALNPGEQLRFTSFRVGSGPPSPGTNFTDAQGSIVFEGTAADMFFVPWHDEAYILQMLIGPEKPKMEITNLMLFVEDEVPFSLSISTHKFHKLTTVQDNTGIRWMMQLEIRIPNLLDYISFDNLNANLAHIIRIDDETDLNTPFIPLEGRDQGILLQHAALNRAVPLLMLNNELWGCPFFFATDDPIGFSFNGGEDGDDYKYTYIPQPMDSEALLVGTDSNEFNYLTTVGDDNQSYIITASPGV